jgi:hypothetical protein
MRRPCGCRTASRGRSTPTLSMRVARVAVPRHNAAPGPAAPPAIRTLAVPGLCTGVGGMPYAESSQQMRAAYDSVIAGRWRQVIHPALAPFALRSG